MNDEKLNELNKKMVDPLLQIRLRLKAEADSVERQIADLCAEIYMFSVKEHVNFDKIVQDSYEYGRETALSWQESYRPGGPFYVSPPPRHWLETGPVDEKIALRVLSKAVYSAWLRGFDENLSQEQKEKIPAYSWKGAFLK